ncbi:hypothetical protein AM501_03045 [Aneurinibacillus migulanus]|uniref:histidine kinase n=1 Tax=Aneurinibacillus migulanus TaxID=47500 RepID=A0A0D1X8V7_ANEMI|nr:ATP-binding protein [Aneurinibacillus migulanus]KIV50702.1 hypothetical protein TS65_29100 [Aneurinibacillus migulanus]KIV50871.1 hypothetical protein TS64_25180 [Aneurinibacillus migulanus]KON99373.1 hypothetical protein AF333_01245 [Aneurinibacillus migulanus]KPD09614.1 hypothetical protein AM501_03045 [Aneurinibacillus migulanus]MCP1354898.1 ATP-binding protein [Aneurinibacillus migulanus]
MSNYESLYIQISKQKCANMGLNPYILPQPSAIPVTELKQRQEQYKEILSTINFFAKKMLFFVNRHPVVLLVTDKNATILDMYGDKVIINHVQQIGIDVGIQFNEEEMGTNSINLALEQLHPVKVIGPEHYHGHLNEAACYTVPFTYNTFDNLAGSLTIFTNMENANDVYLGMLLAVVDSVERELVLRRQNQKLFVLNQIMMSTTKNGIILTDNRGTIIDANDSTENITGYKKNEIIGRSIAMLQPIAEYMYNTLQHEQIHEDILVEFVTGTQQQKTICLFDTLPIYDEKNILNGAYCQFRDITDRHNLEKQIIISEKFSAIGKLSAGFAHEIRNPLTSIAGFIHLLKEKTHPDDANNYYFEIIQNELERVKKLVTNFIVVAKPDTPVRKEHDLRKVMMETVELMESHALLCKVNIQCNLSSVPLLLHIDAMQIKQVIMNIIQNSIEALPDGGNITIQIEETGNENVVISIQDNGCGMTKNELDQVMNPFFTTKDDGLGLGLSISYRIIESHKGSLHVFSEKGTGTTFNIILPKTIGKE